MIIFLALAGLALTIGIIIFLLSKLFLAQQDVNYWKEISQLRHRHRLEEQRQRMVYERALALPLQEPQRNQELWARAQQGDELAELILLEQMDKDLEAGRPSTVIFNFERQ